MIRTGIKYVWKGNGIVPESMRHFDETGRMLGVKVVDGETILGEIATDSNGTLRYYEMGQAKMAGFIELDGYHYFADEDGLIATGNKYVWKGNGIVPEASYEFGKDGKALEGFVTKGDSVYYYQLGKTAKPGVYLVDGYYYFVENGGKVITGTRYYVWEGSGLLKIGHYTFNEKGQIIG